MSLEGFQKSLLLDLYELTMAQSYFRYCPGARASFDLFVRHLPPARSYLLFCGLQDALTYLSQLRFRAGDLEFLKEKGFDRDFLSYLGKLRFRGEVWAMPEGTVFFAGEPVIRVTGNLIEVQLVESYLLNTINYSTLIASKAARIVTAARGRGCHDFSLRRTHGMTAALHAARASVVAGFRGTSNVLAAQLYGINPVGTMAHSFVMSFSSEKESFRAFFETFPKRCILLVDTYDTVQGIRHAIEVAQEFKAKGYFLKGIRLDSGDLLALSRLARRMLDRAGLREVRILASGDLDEYKIDSLALRRAPIDDFGVGTRMGVSQDAPYLDAIYKICEVTDSRGIFLPTMKFSDKKQTLPGRKQVYRVLDRQGRLKKDIIGLEDEKLGQPLLKKVMEAGRLTGVYPSLPRIQKFALKNLESLPVSLRTLYPKKPYSPLLSPGLKRLIQKVSQRIA